MMITHVHVLVGYQYIIQGSLNDNRTQKACILVITNDYIFVFREETKIDFEGV